MVQSAPYLRLTADQQTNTVSLFYQLNKKIPAIILATRVIITCTFRSSTLLENDRTGTGTTLRDRSEEANERAKKERAENEPAGEPRSQGNQLEDRRAGEPRSW